MCNARCTLPVTRGGEGVQGAGYRVPDPQMLCSLYQHQGTPMVAQPMLYHREGCPAIGPL